MTTVQEINERVRELSDDEKLELVDRILAQVALTPEEHEAIWLEEVLARREAYLSGKLEASPLKVVMERLRSRCA